MFDVSDSFRQSGNFRLSRSSVSAEQLVMSTDSEGSASSPTFPTGLIRCLESAVDDSVFMAAVGGRPESFFFRHYRDLQVRFGLAAFNMAPRIRHSGVSVQKYDTHCL